jgi:transcriptional regulator with XRE-family HTH domain
MALGARIKERRKEFQLTQQELAQLIGVGQSTIASLENRDYKKSDHDFELAQALGVTVEWLRTGQAPKFPTEALKVGEKPQPLYAYSDRDDLLIRQRLLIEKVLTLSHRALDRIEPLIDDLSRIDTLEKRKKGA